MLLCVASWCAGIAVRRAVLKQQTRTLGGQEAPFTMESALQYRMTRMVRDTGTLPAVDTSVQVPEGVVMRETYTVGAEWIYVFLAERLPEEWTFPSRVRWASTLLFCLAIPFAALWVVQLSGRIWAGWITAGILVASPSFAVRSSGLELSRENLAIPLFTLFLWMDAKARSSEGKGPWVFAGIGALALAASQCVWDLTQLVTGLWIVACWIRVFRAPSTSAQDRIPVGAVAVALAVASVLNPYLRSKGTLFSPVMAMVLARAIGSLPWPQFNSRKVQAVLLAVISLGAWGVGQVFSENYTHFGRLLLAKIRFANVKPMDPSELDYLQRIMWTPALNSTTWDLTKAYFLFTLIILVVTTLLLALWKKKGGPGWSALWFYTWFLLPVTILFFRFHVFWLLFAAVSIGAGVAWRWKDCRGRSRWLLPGLSFLFIFGGELYLLLFFEPAKTSEAASRNLEVQQLAKALGADVSALKGNRWGRPGASYSSVEHLIRQLEGLEEPGPVLANFGISGSILTYADLPIVLHPKFETPGIRERVRQFYEHLFLKTETELRDWAVQFGARYYVHSNGNLSNLDIRNSPRYMVDAVEPPEHAPVYVFEQRPLEAVLFRQIGGNERYRIFRIVLPEDEAFASRMTRLAQQALEAGDFETAERRVRQALTYHWKYEPARELLAFLLAL
jgi:hypothetical protein